MSDQRNTALDGKCHSADLVELRISKLAMQYNLGSHACTHSDFMSAREELCTELSFPLHSSLVTGGYCFPYIHRNLIYHRKLCKIYPMHRRRSRSGWFGFGQTTFSVI